MSAAASCKITLGNNMVSLNSPSPPKILTRISVSFSCTSVVDKFPSSFYYSLSSSSFSSRRKTLAYSKSSEEAEVSEAEDEWLQKLPDKKKPLYSHSLPCVEAWLRSLGFYQSKDDRAVWFVEKTGWHAHLSLDVTDLYIRFLTADLSFFFFFFLFICLLFYSEIICPIIHSPFSYAVSIRLK